MSITNALNSTYVIVWMCWIYFFTFVIFQKLHFKHVGYRSACMTIQISIPSLPQLRIPHEILSNSQHKD